MRSADERKLELRRLSARADGPLRCALTVYKRHTVSQRRADDSLSIPLTQLRCVVLNGEVPSPLCKQVFGSSVCGADKHIRGMVSSHYVINRV